MDETIINGIINVFNELDGRIDESDEFQGKLQYGFGAKGDPGVTFTPAVDDSGNISWTNDGGLPNPETKNIKGPTGDSGIWIGTTPPTDPDVKVWIDTSGEDGDVEMVSNKTTSISPSSTDTQYPSAKAVYDAVSGVKPEITTKNGIAKMPDGSIGLIQAFYDYLDEKTYTAPSIASFSISGLGGTAEIGTTVSVSSMNHRELNVGFITGNLTLKKDGVTLKNDIAPSASSSSVSFTTQTVGRNTAGSVTFTLSGTNSKGAAFSSIVSKSFYVPKFTGTNANTTVTESDILSMTRNQNLVSAVTLPNLAYVYWVTPRSITSVTNQMVPVPFVKINDVVVTVNGVAYTYHVYRTENRLSQGSSWNFVYGEA